MLAIDGGTPTPAAAVSGARERGCACIIHAPTPRLIRSVPLSYWRPVDEWSRAMTEL